MARFDPDPSFGSVLRRLRQEQGLTIEEAAKRAGVTANYLGDVERGQRNPTMKVVGRILAGIGVTWTRFATRLDDRA